VASRGSGRAGLRKPRAKPNPDGGADAAHHSLSVPEPPRPDRKSGFESTLISSTAIYQRLHLSRSSGASESACMTRSTLSNARCATAQPTSLKLRSLACAVFSGASVRTFVLSDRKHRSERRLTLQSFVADVFDLDRDRGQSFETVGARRPPGFGSWLSERWRDGQRHGMPLDSSSARVTTVRSWPPSP
jgi:hypothetical protein